MALLNSGFNIDDPTVFAGSLQRLINTGFGLKRDEPVEEIEVKLDEEEKKDDEKKDDEEEISLSSDEKENAGQPGEEPELQEIPIQMENV